MNRNINLRMEEVKARLRDRLKPIKEVTVTEAKDIIGKYTAAIEGNFVPWMAAAALYARSLQGEYTAKENLAVEIKDNHQGILRTFARCAKAEPSLKHYQAVEKAVASMRNFIGKGNGLEALTVMATLENTSTVFIPYLAELARKRGSINLCYTDIHGEADAEHAQLFIWAVEHEMKLDQNATRANMVSEFASTQTFHYLKAIF